MTAKTMTDEQIDRSIETKLMGGFSNPVDNTNSADTAMARTSYRSRESISDAAAAVASDPEFLGPEARKMKRSSAELQLRDHVAHLGWFDKFVVQAAMRGAHREAALQLTDALVRTSVETCRAKIAMGSQIMRAELLIEFLKAEPVLAADVSRLCHETRVVLTDQLFKLSDEVFSLRNQRLAQIDQYEKKGLFSREDADEQRELLRQVVADELMDKWERYSLVFKSISRHFVRTLTSALEHVQSSPLGAS